MAQNNADRDRKGRRTPPKGVEHGNAKLTEDDIRAIRAARASGERQRDVAARFGIGQSHVQRIASRQSWAHVT